jgi:MoaA/NifB/PqqE/SkfB family radical SAM enzyme
MEKFVCDHPWTHFEVNNPNGNVTMCCDNNTVLGNVNENTIEEVWNGDGYRTMRRRMHEEGAHALCPHTCPVLNGGKTYQNLDWYKSLDKNGAAYANAAKNVREFEKHKHVLESLPRWMRFAYSYACNLDCYHCYQREDATINLKLPDNFMDQVRRLAKSFQVIFPFGGEPFLFKPVTDFLAEVEVDPGCRYMFVTNATLLTPKIFSLLGERELGVIAVSLDAATEESFDKLRKRGRRADWNGVMDNMRRLQQLKAEKNFIYTVSMTLNSQNFNEIEAFIDLGIRFNAEPLVILVTNPFQTYSFQKRYLMFTDPQFDEMFVQIERGLKKVRKMRYRESENYLLQLRAMLQEHRKSDNSLTYFAAKTHSRQIFWMLPEMLRNPLKRAVNRVRARRLERHKTVSSKAPS